LKLLSQIPTIQQVNDLGKLGEVVLIALALLAAAVAIIVLAIVLYRVVRASGDGDKEDRGLLREMIELATSYKAESSEARDAYKQEAAATRAVIQESNDINRETNIVLTDLTKSTNEQTGEVRLLRKDFASYQTLQTDTTAQLVERFSTFETQFDGIIKLIERNAGDHSEIKEALKDMAKGMRAMHEDVRKLMPPLPPTVIQVNNPAPLDELPKASGQ